MTLRLIPVVVAAALGLAGMAQAAATTTSGVIKAVDMQKHMFSLEDGTLYVLPKHFKDPGLKAGEKVDVTWHMKGKTHEATGVVIQK